MKKILITMLLAASVQSAMASHSENQQQEAINQLEAAQIEINTVKSLLPGFLKNSLGRNLESASNRINYAQQILGGSSNSAKYYCVINSTFDGTFSGKGQSELEARQNALIACKQGSRNDGFFCNKNGITCERQ